MVVVTGTWEAIPHLHAPATGGYSYAVPAYSLVLQQPAGRNYFTQKTHIPVTTTTVV